MSGYRTRRFVDRKRALTFALQTHVHDDARGPETGIVHSDLGHARRLQKVGKDEGRVPDADSVST